MAHHGRTSSCIFSEKQKTNSSFNMSSEQKDENHSISPVYSELAASLTRMKQPLAELLATHDQFVLQNVSAMNDIKTLKSTRRQIEKALEKERQTGKSHEKRPIDAPTT